MAGRYQRITSHKHGWFGLLSSRGCPYRCTYCLNHKIVDRYRDELGRGTSSSGFFRYRPPAKLVDEVQYVLEHYDGIETLIFDDDLFTYDSEHAIATCRAIEEAGIDVPFVVNSHVSRLDPRVAEALARAGCRILKLGIESGSPRVRGEVLQRYMSNEDIVETVSIAEAAGLHTSGFVMVGLPYETRAERLETVDLLARSGVGRFRTSLFYPFPGTESHRLSIEGGFVSEDRAGSLTDFTVSSCLDFGAEENRFVDQLATCMPWFVNARLARYREAPAARRYEPLVQELLAQTSDEWEAFKPRVRELTLRFRRRRVPLASCTGRFNTTRSWASARTGSWPRKRASSGRQQRRVRSPSAWRPWRRQRRNPVDAMTSARCPPDFRELSVAVVGDLIADHSIVCEPRGLSREAPVMVLRHAVETVGAGGAANVARNLRALGARTSIVGAVGRDARGRELLQILADEGIDASGIVTVPGWTTPTKSRVFAAEPRRSRQQVLRIDREPDEPIGDVLRGKLAERVRG